MIRQLWGMARNDLIVWLRSPSSIAAALLPAIGMGILLAVLTNSVGQQPVALVVEGKGRLAARMAKILRADTDAYLLAEMDAASAEQAIGDERVAAIIVVPDNFDVAVAYGIGAVDLYLNNVDIDLADDIRRSVTRSVAEFDAPQLGLLGELSGPSRGLLLPNPYRVAVAEHNLRETDVSFLQYQVIPILILIAISVGVLGTGLLTARDFASNTAKMMVLSPANRLALILGRVLGGSLISISLISPLIFLGFLTRYIPYCSDDLPSQSWLKYFMSAPCAWRLPVPDLIHSITMAALLLAVILATEGMGVLLGIAVRDELLVTMIGLNAAVYLFFLGGGFTTVAFLPEWIQKASRLVPTSYAIEGLRQALFYPDLLGISRDLTVLFLCSLISLTLASIMLDRSWKRI